MLSRPWSPRPRPDTRQAERPRPRPGRPRPRPRPQKSGLDRSRDQDQVSRPTSLRLVSAESQRVILCSASTTKGIISENTITAVCLSMNLVEHTPASLTLLESGALYLMTFSRHIVRLAENLKNDTASWMQSKQWWISTIFDDSDTDRLKECIVQ